MLPLHPDHMLKMFHTEQQELLFVVGRRPLYGTPENLNRARTRKIHGDHTTKDNRGHTMKLDGGPTVKQVLVAVRRVLSGTAPARHLGGPECCTP